MELGVPWNTILETVGAINTASTVRLQFCLYNGTADLFTVGKAIAAWSDQPFAPSVEIKNAWSSIQHILFKNMELCGINLFSFPED